MLVEQIGETNFQPVGEFEQGSDGRIRHAALNLADHRPVNVRFQRKRLLRQTTHQPVRLQVPGDVLSYFFDGARLCLSCWHGAAVFQPCGSCATVYKLQWAE